MTNVILYRKSNPVFDEPELQALTHAGFAVEFNRSRCRNALVVGRYSVLPFYRELEEDLRYNNCTLINSYAQHRYVANFDYYEDMADITFPTWFSYVDIPSSEEGPFIVKGRTNSRKKQWTKLMFARDRKEAVRIQCELYEDPFIGEQGLVFRKYVPLRKVGEGINGQPHTNEWRFFFYGEQELARDFYWEEDERDKADLKPEGVALAHRAASIASKNVNFFAVDVAEGEDGRWWVVELNDGCMSGVPTDACGVQLYANLFKTLAAPTTS